MPVYEHYSDEQLAAAARDEDLDAWEALIQRHGQRLLAFYTRMTGDEALRGHVFAVTRELARSLGLRSFRVVLNDGEDAGQSVHHLHVHLMGGRAFAWPPG